ncbi:MAG: 16S rRNA processing protein RimM [Bdellovibrionales bacterium]|nr:16S rRNA processing protein RimM [Bdellovibrionales bacterium]
MKVSDQEWFVVGHVKSAHGIRGELFVVIPSQEFTWLNQLKSFQLCTVDNKLCEQFDVGRMSPHKNGLIVSSPHLTDRNKAEFFKGYNFLIPIQFVTSQPGEDIYFHEIMNFRVVDKKRGEVGTVKGFSSHSLQDLIEVDGPNGAFDIPFVEQFIVELDFSKKIIYMSLPQGLVPADDED